MPALKREWTPHPKQRAIMNDPTRHRVVPAGRRFGKTRMARAELIEYGFENPDGYSWFMAPTDGDALELGFEPMLQELPADLLEGGPGGQKRSPPREIYLTNGHRFQFRGEGSHGRGRGLDFVVMDECGEYENRTWNEVVRPSLLDTGGRALLTGTPKGATGFFYELYLRGEDPDDDEVNSWQATTYDNPEIPDSEVEAERATMPERVFRQEYLAEFLEAEGAVFGDVRDRNGRPYHVDDVEGTAPYTTGVDFGRVSDYLVAATLDADGMLVGFMRDRGFAWPTARRRLEAYLSGFPGTAYMDANRDNAVIEDLARALGDVVVEPFKFTRPSKADLVENLAARLETEDIILPAHSKDVEGNAERETDALYGELEAFTYDSTSAGNVQYHAPEGFHDDCVDAFALAAKRGKNQNMSWR